MYEQVSPETMEVSKLLGYYVKLPYYSFGMKKKLWPMKPR